LFFCQTRNAQTIHLGAKEYTPNFDQQSTMKATRVWTQDAGVTKEQTMALLPELLLTNNIILQVSKSSHENKMQIHNKFRLAGTCFTRVAVNSTACKFHRDFGVGLDALIYAGDWAMGGDVIIPQLGIRIVVKPGDVIVMDSGLFHKVTDFEGTRFVAVFFSKTHNEVSKSGELKVPQELSWLSNPDFKESAY